MSNVLLSDETLHFVTSICAEAGLTATEQRNLLREPRRQSDAQELVEALRRTGGSQKLGGESVDQYAETEISCLQGFQLIHLTDVLRGHFSWQ